MFRCLPVFFLLAVVCCHAEVSCMNPAFIKEKSSSFGRKNVYGEINYSVSEIQLEPNELSKKKNYRLVQSTINLEQNKAVG